MSDNNRYAGQQMINILQQETLTAAKINASQATALGNAAKIKADDLAKKNAILEQANETLRTEVTYYKNLLSQPLQAIAEKNKDFKNTYELQQQLLADWMVSQRAFKELAINLGIQLDMTKEEVVSEGTKNKNKVLNNNTEYGNDEKDLSIDGKSIKSILKK